MTGKLRLEDLRVADGPKRVRGRTVVNEHRPATIADWVEVGRQLGAEEIQRYATHHVYLGEDGFTVEHPVTCDLRACSYFERLQVLWDEQPGPTGWYEVDLNGALSRAQERQTYMLLPVESPTPKEGA